MLTLSIKREPWRGSKKSSPWVEKEFNAIKASKKKSDKYTCVHCRFKSDKYQESHHIDNNHKNNKPENLATICPLCHSCHHIGLAGMQNRGFLVWLPEWKQEHINRFSIFMRFIINTTEDNNHANIKASEFFDEMLNRHKLLKNEIGDNLSDITSLSRYLQIMGNHQYDKRARSLRSIRFIPNFDSEYLKPRMDYWTKLFTSKLPIGSWDSIIEGSKL